MSFSARRSAFRRRFLEGKCRIHRRLGRNVRTVALGFSFTARDPIPDRFHELVISLQRLAAELRNDYKCHRVAAIQPDLVRDCFVRPNPRLIRRWYFAMKRLKMRQRLRQHRQIMRVIGRRVRGLPPPPSLVHVDLAISPDTTVFAHWRVHESGMVEFLESWSEP